MRTRSYFEGGTRQALSKAGTANIRLDACTEKQAVTVNIDSLATQKDDHEELAQCIQGITLGFWAAFRNWIQNVVVRPNAALFKAAYQADAGAHPGAMMVKFLDTVVTHGTVRAAGRPPVVACGAPLGLDHKAVDLVFLETRPRPAATTPCRYCCCCLVLS